MADEHSAFGGSVISRRIKCVASYALEQTVPKKPSSEAADEGSLAHGFAEYMLKNGDRDAYAYVGATLDAQVGAKPLTEEMAKAIQVYLDEVWAEFDKTKDAELYVEQKFVIDVESAEPGEVHGKNDCTVYHPSIGRLRGFDYKHGVGISVSADDNDQLKFYMTGAVFSNDWKVSELILTIVQPRARDIGTIDAAGNEIGAIRDWTFDTVDLLEFKAQVNEAVRKAKSVGPFGSGILLPDPHDAFLDNLFALGSHCRWCDAAAVCPAKQAEAVSPFGDVQIDIETVSIDHLEDPKDLVPERLSRIVAGLSVLQAYANQCQEYLEALLMQGIEVPGWKVVEKIGRAKWISDEQAIASNLELFYGLDENLIRPRKLTTITEVEKLLKGAGATKSEIDDFKLANTIKESSGLTVAPESDRRPAINAAERSFGDVQT